MIRRILLAALSLSISVPLFAGLSAKYKDWPSTPQGYFMTAAERAQWATLTSDGDAEKFVQQFLAARGGEFPAEVAKRAEMADKYLTIGKTPGSKTLRGKAIILLGPPAAMDVHDAAEDEAKGRSRGMGEAISRAGGMDNATASGKNGTKIAGAGGVTPNDALGATVSSLDAARVKRHYSFTFQNDITKQLDKTSLVVNIVADPASGKDELANRADDADLQKAFETAAQASVVKK
jgi:GWxTD domain-containing protein